MNVRKAKGQLRMDNQETLAALSAGRRQTDKNTEHRKLIKRVTGTPSNNRG